MLDFYYSPLHFYLLTTLFPLVNFVSFHDINEFLHFNFLGLLFVLFLIGDFVSISSLLNTLMIALTIIIQVTH